MWRPDRTAIADEISGIVVGSGYESVTIGIDAALEAADALLASGVFTGGLTPGGLTADEFDAAVAAHDAEVLATADRGNESAWRKAIADQVRRNYTPSGEAYEKGGDALIYAVCDWIENPPEWSKFVAPSPDRVTEPKVNGSEMPIDSQEGGDVAWRDLDAVSVGTGARKTGLADGSV